MGPLKKAISSCDSVVVGRRVQRASFQARINALVAADPLLAGTTERMLRCWAVLWSEYKRLHALLVQLVGQDELCRRFCHSRRRAGGGAHVQGCDRRSGTLLQIENCWGAFWAGAAARTTGDVGRQRRPHLQGRRRRGAHRSTRPPVR